MSSWGNNDNAANTPLWATAAVNLQPTSVNATSLFDNTTFEDFKVATAGGGYRHADQTIGVFGLDSNEIAVDGNKGAHTGWVLRTVGSGGRANRVQEEVLVAMNTIQQDSDGQVYANVTINLSVTNLQSVVHSAANANTVLFTVTPTLTGNTSAALTFQWQVNNNSGGTWVNMADGNDPQPGGIRKAGVTSATFQATPWLTTANNYVFRCIVTAADEGVTATSANGRILIS